MLTHACGDHCFTIGESMETLYEVLGLDRPVRVLII